MEHHSNIVPWHFIRERQGAKLVWVPVGEGWRLLTSRNSRERLTDRTKLVAITHMSNALGTVVPIRQIVENRPCARHQGDGRRQPGCGASLPVDVRDLGCDFYVCTGHKL